MPSFQHGARHFSDTDSIPRCKTFSSKYFFSFRKQLIIRYKSRTYINDIYPFNNFFSPRHRFKILTTGNHGSYNAIAGFIGNSFQQNIRRHHRNSQTTHPVCLHRETAFPGHCFNDSFYLGACLHQLVRSQVTYIPSPHSQHIFPQQCHLIIHHFLYHGRCINSRQIVIFKSRHKRYSSGSHYQIIGIDKEYLFCRNILYGNPLPFQ